IARADLNINQTFALPPRDALPLIGSKEPQVVLLPDANYVAAVVILVQFDDGCDVIGVRQQNDLRFFTANKRQGIAWRQSEGLIDIEIGTRNNFQLLVEHDGCGKASGLC